MTNVNTLRNHADLAIIWVLTLDEREREEKRANDSQTVIKSSSMRQHVMNKHWHMTVFGFCFFLLSLLFISLEIDFNFVRVSKNIWKAFQNIPLPIHSIPLHFRSSYSFFIAFSIWSSNSLWEKIECNVPDGDESKNIIWFYSPVDRCKKQRKLHFINYLFIYFLWELFFCWK